MSKSQTAVLRTPASSRRFLFALNFFKSPAMLGSLIPSSRFLVNDVLNQVDWDKARVIVEYGPGVRNPGSAASAQCPGRQAQRRRHQAA